MAEVAVDVHGCGVTVRPCPRTDCRHHLAHGESPHFYDRRPDTSDTCSLDVAKRGKAGLAQVGRKLGLSRERIRQIEDHALVKLGPKAALLLGEPLPKREERRNA